MSNVENINLASMNMILSAGNARELYNQSMDCVENGDFTEGERLLARAEQEGYAAVAIDGYALFESGCDKLCDTTVGVLAPAEIRVRRIMDREGISEDYARARVAAQRDDDFYRQRCGHILMNDCASPEEFGQRARAFFQSVI